MKAIDNVKTSYPWWQLAAITDYRSKFLLAISNSDLLEYQEKRTIINDLSRNLDLHNPTQKLA